MVVNGPKKRNEFIIFLENMCYKGHRSNQHKNARSQKVFRNNSHVSLKIFNTFKFLSTIKLLKNSSFVYILNYLVIVFFLRLAEIPKRVTKWHHHVAMAFGQKLVPTILFLHRVYCAHITHSTTICEWMKNGEGIMFLNFSKLITKTKITNMIEKFL